MTAEGKKLPLVSVCIPVYNRVQYVQETIASILAQQYPNYEIVVQDNASTDGTWEALLNLSQHYPQLSIQRNEKNLGSFFNWNEVIRRSKGEYVMWLSSDDLIEPEFLSETMRTFEKNPDIGAVSVNYCFLEDGQKRARQIKFSSGIQQNLSAKLLRHPGFLNINFTVFTRETVNRMQKRNNLASYNLMTADFDLFLRMSLQSIGIFFISEPLGNYRLHEGNDSKQGKKMRMHLILVLLRHRKVLLERYSILYRFVLLRYLVRLLRPTQFNHRLTKVLIGRIASCH